MILLECLLVEFTSVAVVDRVDCRLFGLDLIEEAVDFASGL